MAPDQSGYQEDCQCPGKTNLLWITAPVPHALSRARRMRLSERVGARGGPPHFCSPAPWTLVAVRAQARVLDKKNAPTRSRQTAGRPGQCQSGKLVEKWQVGGGWSEKNRSLGSSSSQELFNRQYRYCVSPLLLKSCLVLVVGWCSLLLLKELLG